MTTHVTTGMTDRMITYRVKVKQTATMAATLVLLGLTALPSAMEAQVIHGRLLDDSTSEPIPGAVLVLLEEGGEPAGRTLSDSLGVFFLNADLGEYQLRAQRLGYGTTTSMPFQISVVDTVSVEFYLSTEAIPMTPLFISVPRRPGREIFERRMATEEGVHFTPEMVDSLRPKTHIGEIFRKADKTWVTWGWGRHEDGSMGPIPRVFTRLGKYGCLHWIVDRTPVPAPFFERSVWGVPPLSEVTPEDVVAIELYRAWHEVPEDFAKELRVQNGWQQEALKRIHRKVCGLVVIWTREGW